MSTTPAVSAKVRRGARHLGILSTYPPRLCGLATFAAALEFELARAGEQVTIVAVHDDPSDGVARGQRGPVLVNGSEESVREAAGLLSLCDAVIVQHEYGVYGGTDGDEVIDLLGLLDAPAIVVLHTVLSAPTDHQRSVLEAVCGLAASVVVMTSTAHARLLAGYDVEPGKVVTIPHGAWPVPDPLSSAPEPSAGGRTRLLTWGLLGPGKGIEHAIGAMALLTDLHPHIKYTVAGVTHPNVLASQGDQYRQSLVRQTWESGVARSVTFDDTYRDVPTLVRFVAASSVVVLPYDSPDQVTSGVLVDAIAAGRPVIATPFPHAVELLSDGAGILVPHRDPSALAQAIRTVATDSDVLASMTERAVQLAPTLAWSAVAARYRALCDDLVAPAAMASA